MSNIAYITPDGALVRACGMGNEHQTYVKNFYYVLRNGTECFQTEVLNEERTKEMLEISRKANELLERAKGYPQRDAEESAPHQCDVPNPRK